MVDAVVEYDDIRIGRQEKSVVQGAMVFAVVNVPAGRDIGAEAARVSNVLDSVLAGIGRAVVAKDAKVIRDTMRKLGTDCQSIEIAFSDSYQVMSRLG